MRSDGRRRASVALAAVLVMAGLCSCTVIPIPHPGEGFASGEAAALHAAFPDDDRAALITTGRIAPGTLRIDARDPPLRGGAVLGLLRFDGLIGESDGQVPPGSIVYRAELTLTTTQRGAGAALHRMLQPWDAGATWREFFDNSQGRAGMLPGVQTDGVEAVATPDLTTGPVALGAARLDVTASVQAWADGAPNHGWVFRPLGADAWSFAAFDAALPAARPRLRVLHGPPHERVAVASGDVSSDSAVLLAQPTATGAVTVRVAADPDFAEVVAAFEAESDDLLVPVKLVVEGLAAGMRYWYEARDAAGQADVGTFRTAAGAEERRGLRFGVSGDWRGELRPYPALANLPGERLDFFVALGDTIYADVPSPAVPKRQCTTLEDFRRKHAEVYADALGRKSMADVRASTAWLSTIDDHEVTNDFSGGAHPSAHPLFAGYAGAFIHETELFDNALRAFVEHHPMRDEYYGDTGDPRTAHKRKLYRFRRYGRDAAVFVLDARSFRDEEIPRLASPGARNAQTWFQNAFEPGRTMLGAAQIEQLMADLLEAEAAGVTWKFVVVPEPIQNLGPILGEDRFEGYAAERTRLLRFLHENGLRNVVFIAADIHCAIINNISYRHGYGQPQIATDMWEITTGATAYAAPFGPTVVSILAGVPIIGPLFELIYEGLDRDGKDELIVDSINTLLEGWGYDPIGLSGSSVPATLLEGRWASLHTYGWTLFEIDAATQRLTVTTYGIDWYDRETLLDDPFDVLDRRPRVVSRFVVEAAE